MVGERESHQVETREWLRAEGKEVEASYISLWWWKRCRCKFGRKIHKKTRKNKLRKTESIPPLPEHTQEAIESLTTNKIFLKEVESFS
jgi:hypothetical protein